VRDTLKAVPDRLMLVIITGSGVQALLGGFDTQVKAGQQVLQELFEDVIGLCFEMDERLFGGLKKITGSQTGTPYEISYDSLKDINGDYTVQARYGLMAGLDPNRALIFALQALQANLASRDFVMRELPWSMNVSAEQEKIDVERMRDSLAGSLAATAQAIPNMAAQGQDPSDIINKMARVIELRRRGKDIEDAVLESFAPEEPEQEMEMPEPPMPPEQMLAAMGGGVPPEQAPPGPATEEPAGPPQAQQPPPDIATMLAAMGG